MLRDMILKDRRSRRKRVCPLDRNKVPHPIRFAELTYRFTLYRSAHFVNSSNYVQQAIGQRRAEGYCAVLLVSTIIWISTLLQALFENFDPDPLKTLTETKIGLQGMKIDRMFFEKFEDAVKQDTVAKEQYEQGHYAAAQRYIEETYLNQPSEFFTWDKLRRATGVDRRVTVREMLDKIFGIIPAFKSKKELVSDEFDNYMLTCGVAPGEYYEIRRFFETYLTDKEVRRVIEDGKYQLLGTQVPSYSFADLKRLGISNMRSVIGYVNDNVNLSKLKRRKY